MNINPYDKPIDPWADDDAPEADAVSVAPVSVAKPPTTVAPVVAPAEFYEVQWQAIKGALEPFEAQIKEMAAKAKTIVIETDEAEAAALDDIGFPLDRLAKDIEAERKRIVEAPNAYLSKINALAGHYKDLAKSGSDAIKSAVKTYRNLKAIEAQRKALEEEKAAKDAREKALAAQEKLKKEAAEMGVDASFDFVTPEPPKPVQPAEPAKTVRTGKGKATAAKKWVHSIIDSALVPREYLTVDEKAVKEAIKNGIREIPGIQIYQDEDIKFSS
jgi:hypothetical protein